MMVEVGPGCGPVPPLMTLMAERPLFPSLVAVTVIDPGATPVTSPFADTVAIATLLERQVTLRPVTAFPFPSLSTTLSCCTPPIPTLADAGLTVTDATGTAFTLIAPELDLPSLVAVIDTAPG